MYSESVRPIGLNKTSRTNGRCVNKREAEKSNLNLENRWSSREETHEAKRRNSYLLGVHEAKESYTLRKKWQRVNKLMKLKAEWAIYLLRVQGWKAFLF